jgi:hypothetical protein
MSGKTSEKVEIEESEKEKNVLVVDPDDYQRTKKLKLINKAKEEVISLRHDREDAIGYLGDNFAGEGIETYHMKLAQTVAQYGSELLPLIEEGLEKGALEEDDTITRKVPDQTKGLDVVAFVQRDGRISNGNEARRPPEPLTLAIYRQLERIERELGLGLDLEEDKGPANI